MKQSVAVWMGIFLLGSLAGAGMVTVWMAPDDAVALKQVNPVTMPEARDEGILEEPSREVMIERIEQLEAQLEQLKQVSENEAFVESEPSEAQLRRLKRQWTEGVIFSTESSRFARRSEREQNQLIESLGLTPEQAMELSRLVEKRDAQRRLMMLRGMGVLTEEESSNLFAELEQFDYELALTSLLSEQQKAVREAMEAEQRDRGVERVTEAMANRLGVTGGDRFSADEQIQVQQSIRSALDPDIDLWVPPAIADLPIHELNKRILSAGFQQLDSETFEKLYESVVEASEDGDGVPRGAGRRRMAVPAR